MDQDTRTPGDINRATSAYDPRALTHAIVRTPGASYRQAISSGHAAIDVALAQAQHAKYCAALRAAGLDVTVLPADERYPDSCFMQDPVIVINGRAIICRMAAASRRGEEEGAAAALAGRFPTSAIAAPGTLEGGDLLVLPDRVLAGLSARSNAAGSTQLAAALEPVGMPVVPVPVTEYLHLLTAVNYLGHGLALALEDYAQHPALAGLEVLRVPRAESYAVNVLAAGRSVVLPAGFPQVAGLLRAAGFELLPVPVSEFAKADGGVTCLSLVW